MSEATSFFFGVIVLPACRCVLLLYRPVYFVVGTLFRLFKVYPPLVDSLPPPSPLTPVGVRMLWGGAGGLNPLTTTRLQIDVFSFGLAALLLFLRYL